MADTHKLIGTHAEEIAGVMYGPGETFTLTDEQLKDPQVKDRLDNGVLMSLKGGDK